MTTHPPRYPDTALLIVGHGSTVNPDSGAPSLAHAAAIRKRNLFARVACAFWKEEPSLRDWPLLFNGDDDPPIRTCASCPTSSARDISPARSSRANSTSTAVPDGTRAAPMRGHGIAGTIARPWAIIRP